MTPNNPRGPILFTLGSSGGALGYKIHRRIIVFEKGQLFTALGRIFVVDVMLTAAFVSTFNLRQKICYTLLLKFHQI